MPERTLEERMNAPRTLVIDDDPDDRFSIARSLQKYAGAKVDEAATLEEAYTLLSLQQYDLIVSDTQLPTGKGYVILDEINGHRRFPVIGLSNAIEVRENKGESLTHAHQPQSLYYIDHWLRRGAEAAWRKDIIYQKNDELTGIIYEKIGEAFAARVKQVLHDYYFPN